MRGWLAVFLVCVASACEGSDESFRDAAVDAPTDVSSDRPGDAIDWSKCDCAEDERCVVFLGGVCQQVYSPRCVRTACTECNEECDRELCGQPDGGVQFTCSAAQCGFERPDVFFCYGP